MREILEEAEGQGKNLITINLTPKEVNYLIKRMMRIPIHMGFEEQFEMWFAILEKFGLKKAVENLKTIFFNNQEKK